MSSLGASQHYMHASTLSNEYIAVPDIPHLPDLILANRSSVALRLDAFRDGGCPIQYFVIEYRRESEHNFKLVAKNVSARENVRSIAGLEPATRYYIRVTAFNAAG